MNCRQLQESLGDHSVGLLHGPILIEFERHVTICADCAKAVRQFHHLLELLDHTPSPRPPDGIWLGVRAGIEVERSVQMQTHHARKLPIRWPWRSGLAAAAAGFAAATVLMVGATANRRGQIAILDDAPLSTVSPVSATPLQFAPDIVSITAGNGPSFGARGVPMGADGMPVILGMPMEHVHRGHRPGHTLPLDPFQGHPWPHHPQLQPTPGNDGIAPPQPATP